MWDSKDATYTGYRSSSDCEQSTYDCKKVVDECGGTPIFTGGRAYDMLWQDYSNGGIINIKLLDDDGYCIRKLCSLRK